jgi:enoyl-CoA hydratase/carnithine racemase
LVVLTGAETSFCAGADLGWMKSVLAAPFEDNLEEARLLADTLAPSTSCRSRSSAASTARPWAAAWGWPR